MWQDVATAQNALRAVAGDPGWGYAQQTARKNARGDYLGGDRNFWGALVNFSNAYHNQNPTYANTVSGGYVNNAANDTQFRTAGGIESALGRMNQGARIPNQVTQNTLAGSYVQNAPKVNADNIAGSIRSAMNAQAADSGANIRSAFSRAGLGFSTGNQQAEQANNAAANARANELEAQTRFAADQANQQSTLAERGIQSAAAMAEDAAQRDLAKYAAGARIGATQFDSASDQARFAQERSYQQQAAMDAQNALREAALFDTTARLENYGRERAYQNTAAQQLGAAFSQPLNYLSSVSNLPLDQVAQIANIISGLAGHGQVETPRTQMHYEKGVYDEILGLVGAVGGAVGNYM